MKESELYHIWAKQLVNHDLRTITGEPVRVLYPGNLNSDKGADFKDANLKIGDQVFHGDVEVHINKRDWNYHKHQHDTEYNKVILHLIWANDNSVVKTEANNAIPTLLLSDFYLPTPEVTKKIAYDCHFFSGLDKEQLNYVLLKCGQKRLREKAEKYQQLSYVEPVEETIYRFIAVALGSPNNSLGMTLVASSIKKRKLVELEESVLPAFIEEKLDLVGLNEKSSNSKIWNKFRIRPASQPAKRVKEFIELRWKFRNINLALVIWDEFNESSDLKNFINKMEKLFSTEQGNTPFGKEIVKIIIFNSLLPWLYSLVIELKHKKNLVKIDSYIKDFPRIGNNRVTSTFGNKISDYQINKLSKKEIYCQGMYYLMNNFCRRHDCQSCRNERDSYLTLREINERYKARK